MESVHRDLPLDGVRVLEIGGGYPAAFATRFMAGFGADVVRTEPAESVLTDDEAVYLLAGKRRIAVEDRRLAELAAAADIVVEDQLPGALARRGLDPAELRTAVPESVVVSITPFGQEGPYSAFELTNLTAFAMGGIMGLTGDPAPRPPLQTGGSQAYALGGLNAFSAAVAAYYGALVHGEGDWIDLSLQECAAGILELYAARSAYAGTGPAVRSGNQVSAVWGVYPVADGFGAVCCLQRQIPAFFRVVGDPELQEERFMDPFQRLSQDDELRARLYAWFSTQTKEDLLRLGTENRIPFGAVLTPGDLLESPALAEREFFDTVQTPDGVARVPGRPFLGLGWRSGDLAAPGADTDAVLDEWLGGGR